jgi:hypothetical protein
MFPPKPANSCVSLDKKEGKKINKKTYIRRKTNHVARR